MVQDIDITYRGNLNFDTIPTDRYGITEQRAMLLRDELKPNDQIAVRNRNNLSEVHIYKRTTFQKHDPSIPAWDGVTVDTSWYDNKENSIYELHTVEQFAGLSKLVEEGNSFNGKLIRLCTNIDLNNHEWKPIGHIYTSNPSISFSGTFDGCSNVIYGLRINDNSSADLMHGLFGQTDGATIKNLVLENVHIGNCDYQGMFAAVCGWASNTIFTNIIVSGEIKGTSCSSIACQTLNTSFYKCINYADLIVKAETFKTGLSFLGGIVQKIGLSEDMINAIGNRSSNIFVKCAQKGKMVAYAKLVEDFCAGGLYAEASDTLRKNYAITISKCTVRNDLHVFDLREDIPFVFFGYKDNQSEPASFTGANTKNRFCMLKKDLLDGLIGKTSSSIEVNVINVTASTNIDKLVLEGSVNILQSKFLRNDFMTVDANPISEEDGIDNLEPYYTYVKTRSI